MLHWEIEQENAQKNFALGEIPKRRKKSNPLVCRQQQSPVANPNPFPQPAANPKLPAALFAEIKEPATNPLPRRLRSWEWFVGFVARHKHRKVRNAKPNLQSGSLAAFSLHSPARKENRTQRNQTKRRRPYFYNLLFVLRDFRIFPDGTRSSAVSFPILGFRLRTSF